MLPEIDYEEDYELGDEATDDYEEESYPNKTYKMDLVNKCIIGKCDDKDALKQALYKILNTELGEDLIYGDDYGIETHDLYGDDLIYVESEIKVRIKEAILADERFETVEDFIITRNNGKMLISFTVYTVNNEAIEVEEGVVLDV